MITAERYNDIQRARREKFRAQEKVAETDLELSRACQRALDGGATLRDIGQILGLSKEGARQIAKKAQNWSGHECAKHQNYSR